MVVDRELLSVCRVFTKPKAEGRLALGAVRLEHGSAALNWNPCTKVPAAHIFLTTITFSRGNTIIAECLQHSKHNMVCNLDIIRRIFLTYMPLENQNDLSPGRCGAGSGLRCRPHAEKSRSSSSSFRKSQGIYPRITGNQNGEDVRCAFRCSDGEGTSISALVHDLWSRNLLPSFSALADSSRMPY